MEWNAWKNGAKTSPAAFDDDADSKTNMACVWVCLRLCVSSKTEN